MLLQRVHSGISPAPIELKIAFDFRTDATEIMLNSSITVPNTFPLLKNDLLLVGGIVGGEVVRVLSPCSSVCTVERGHPTPTGLTTWPGGTQASTALAGSAITFIKRPATPPQSKTFFVLTKVLGYSDVLIYLDKDNLTSLTPSALTDGDVLTI